MATAAELIVESLVAHGIDRLFCVPGESYLALLDALHGRPTSTRWCAATRPGRGSWRSPMRASGRPGVACVSRGPGASNAAIAVHTAQQDAVPFSC